MTFKTRRRGNFSLILLRLDFLFRAQVGEYTGITDLGYVFAKEVPGTLPLQAYWDSTEEDSCASISDEHCPGVVEGTLGYVIDEVHKTMFCLNLRYVHVCSMLLELHERVTDVLVTTGSRSTLLKFHGLR